MSSFVLKIIACITMLLCHIPFVFPDLSIPLLYIGKLSFPIYAFLISEGYIHTKNFSKYLTRLMVFAVISQIPAYILFQPGKMYFNIFFTLAFGLLGIKAIDKISEKYISVPIVILLAFLAEVFGFDYGCIGVLMIVCFYYFKSNKLSMVLAEMFLMFILYIKNFSYYAQTVENLKFILLQLLFSVASLLFILFYNGKKGKSNKAIQLLFYCFYPVHLIILNLLKLYIS